MTLSLSIEEKILANISFVTLVIDRSFNIVYANKTICANLGLAAEEIIGRPCYEVSHNSSTPCWKEKGITCPAKIAFEENRPVKTIHKHKIKNKFTVEEIRATPFDEAQYVVEEIRDISGLLGLIDGILPICASCKRIRDEQGDWHEIEGYFHEKTGADFSHSLCDKCVKKLYPQFYPEK